MAVTGKGKVIAVDGGNALIRVIRKSACDACEGKAACEGSLVGECSKSVEVTVLAGNEIGAGVGDEVEYTSSTAMTLGIAFTVFIIPLLVGFVSYFATDALCPEGDLFMPYAVSFLLFVLSCAGLFFGIDHALKGKIKTHVSKILNSESERNI